MGNHKFRLSHMIPNAWFHKLNNMTNTITTNHRKPPSGSHHSSSTTATSPPENHHFRHPTKPSKTSTPNRKTIYKSSPKPTESIHPTESTQPTESTHSGLTSFTSPPSSSISHIKTNLHKPKNTNFSQNIELQLPPIITKPSSRNQRSSLSGEKVNQSNQTPATKKLLESFAIVKSSFDPEKDFMESMVEMITENNIRSDKDLEELLGYYLSLNSDEYHDVIIKAFEKIWFSL